MTLLLWKYVSEACHWVSHINSRTPPQTSKPALNGHLLPSCSLRCFDLHGQFLMISASCLGERLHSRLFDKVLSEPAEYFILFFPYGDELLLTAQRLVQHIAKCKRSDHKWGLTLSRAGSHPSQGRPPVAVCNNAARLLRSPSPSLPSSIIELLTAAVKIAARVYSLFCFFCFFSPFVSLDTVGMALSVLDNESVSIWLFCLSIRHSNIFDTLLAAVWWIETWMWPPHLINALAVLADAQGSGCLVQTSGNNSNEEYESKKKSDCGPTRRCQKRVGFINSCLRNISSLSMFLVKSVCLHFLCL